VPKPVKFAFDNAILDLELAVQFVESGGAACAQGVVDVQGQQQNKFLLINKLIAARVM